MSRLYVLMEVVKTDAVDVDGNAVYHPVDGGRGELMWLRTDRVIECADSGPVYRVPKKGDTTISTNPFIPYKAKLDWPYNVHRCLCFPAPEREVAPEWKKEPAFARGFRKGQESVLRKNNSGCCCKFDEDDTIVELCAAHADYVKHNKLDPAPGREEVL